MCSQDLIDWCCSRSQLLKFWKQFTTLKCIPMSLHTEIKDALIFKTRISQSLENPINLENLNSPILLLFDRIKEISGQLPKLKKLSMECRLHWKEETKEFYCLSNPDAISEVYQFSNHHQNLCLSPVSGGICHRGTWRIPLSMSTSWKMTLPCPKLWLTLSSEMERKGVKFFEFPLPSQKILTTELKVNMETTTSKTENTLEDVGKKGHFLYYIKNNQVFVHNLNTGENRTPFELSSQSNKSSIEVDEKGNLQGIFQVKLFDKIEIIQIGKWRYKENKWVNTRKPTTFSSSRRICDVKASNGLFWTIEDHSYKVYMIASYTEDGTWLRDIRLDSGFPVDWIIFKNVIAWTAGATVFIHDIAQNHIRSFYACADRFGFIRNNLYYLEYKKWNRITGSYKTTTNGKRNKYARGDLSLSLGNSKWKVFIGKNVTAVIPVISSISPPSLNHIHFYE